MNWFALLFPSFSCMSCLTSQTHQKIRKYKAPLLTGTGADKYLWLLQSPSIWKWKPNWIFPTAEKGQMSVMFVGGFPVWKELLFYCLLFPKPVKHMFSKGQISSSYHKINVAQFFHISQFSVSQFDFCNAQTKQDIWNVTISSENF